MFLPGLVALIIPSASTVSRSIPKQFHCPTPARHPSGEVRAAGDDHLKLFEERNGSGD